MSSKDALQAALVAAGFQLSDYPRSEPRLWLHPKLLDVAVYIYAAGRWEVLKLRTGGRFEGDNAATLQAALRQLEPTGKATHEGRHAADPGPNDGTNEGGAGNGWLRARGAD